MAHIRWYPDRLVFFMKLPVVFRYAVIDLETTGLDPHGDEIVAFGWVYKDRVYGLVRRTMPHVEIREKARRLVLAAMGEGADVYAWNKGFEEGFLGLRGLRELQLKDREKKDLALNWGLTPPAAGHEVPVLWEEGRYVQVLMRAVYDALIEAASVPRLRLARLPVFDSID